ncbi:MAG: BamA/TamA family outer membrane protein, partial [Gemmatimonadota bacterium]|nr:BamA/TamA family outer membrane protein [Gemmatimonadota bacterium]
MIRLVRARPAGRAAVALLLGLAGAASAVLSLEAQTRGAPEVVDLHFVGNEALSDGELRAVIQTRETSCTSFLLQPVCALTDWGFAHRRAYLDSLDVQGDALRLRTFYTLRGYFNATVASDIRAGPEEARIWFTIAEGGLTRIDSLRIRGLPDVLPLEEAERLLGLRPGDGFDQIRLEQGKESLLRALRERGFIEALVLQDARRQSGGPARVTIEVSPGPRFRIGDVRIQGAESIGEGVVRDLLTFNAGQYFSQSRLEDSQRNLFALDAVRFASIQSVQPGPDSIVDLEVTLTPAAARAARGGLGWSTDECMLTEARLTHRNFLGGAKRLQVTARLKNIFAQQLGGSFPCSSVGAAADFRTLNFLLQAELSVPVFFSGRNSLRASLFGERETVPDVFIREGVGAELSVTRRLRRGMSLTLGYEPAFTGFDPQSADIFFCVNFGFCTNEDIETVTRARWLAPFTLSWIWDRTDRPLQPTAGSYLTAEAEHAGPLTGSDYRYVRLTAQAAVFKEIEPGLVFAARIRAGAVEPTRGPFSVADPSREDEIIHPSKRFFAGGSQSVRGFGQNLLGPRVLVVDQAEDCRENELPFSCVERLAVEDQGAFQQRPIGGNASYEFSLELRQSLGERWGFVLFVDAGDVSDDLGVLRAPVWTPGAGVRFVS